MTGATESAATKPRPKRQQTPRESRCSYGAYSCAVCGGWHNTKMSFAFWLMARRPNHCSKDGEHLMDKAELLTEMDALMRSLRQCDTQASAVKWMTRAYNAMDGATRLVGDLERKVREEASRDRGLIFQIPTPKLEVVQEIPKAIAHRAPASKSANYARPSGETVVYPDFFMHPGLKPAPRPWTREDTRRLEAAAKMGPKRIVRLGR